MKIMRLAIAAGCLAWSGQALAEVRIILEPFRPAGEQGMTFQQHSNNTALLPGTPPKLEYASASMSSGPTSSLDVETIRFSK